MPDQETKVMRRYWLIIARGILRFVAVLAGMFFLAGRPSYWQAWGYGGMGPVVRADGRSPVRQQARRDRAAGAARTGDEVVGQSFFALYIPSFLAILVVAALDAGRYHWTPPLPVPAYVAAYMVLVVAYGIVLWAMWTNRFFSSVVRIQTDRGHHVVHDGPYRFVRHPGYVGAILLGLASAAASARCGP